MHPGIFVVAFQQLAVEQLAVVGVQPQHRLIQQQIGRVGSQGHHRI